MISAHDVEHAAFGRAESGKSGYAEVPVDDFLDRVVLTLTAIERDEQAPRDAVTSKDVVEVVFEEKGPETAGGYDLDDVDDLLDQVAQRLYAVEKGRRAPHETVADERYEEPAAPELQDPDPTWADASRNDEAADQRFEDEDAQREVTPVDAERHDVESTQEKPREEVRPVEPVATSATGGDRVHDLRDPSRHDDLHDARTISEPQIVETSTAGTGGPADEAQPQADVEQYPATDHRVPLPRGDVRDRLSEDDVRASENYHPEFSEYDASRSVGESPAGNDRGPDAGVLPSAPRETADAERGTSPQREPGDESLSDAARATSDAHEPARSAEADDAVTSDDRPMERPESVGRPEPIDAPQGLPAREDTSRKGLLRRIFKG